MKLQKLPFIQIFQCRGRNRLVRTYFFVSAMLIGGCLSSAGLLEIYFRYNEGVEQVRRLQLDAANAAAVRIESFVRDIATTMKAAAKSAGISSTEISSEFEFELKRLLFLAPAITEALALDADGLIQAQASRFRAVSPMIKRDLSQSVAFREATQGKSHFGNVYLRDYDPFLTVAVPIEYVPGEVKGVLQAEVNVKDILDLASNVKLGAGGYGYVITRTGDLIAHSDITMVLQQHKLGQLNHIKAAFEPTSDTRKQDAIVTHNIEGQKVFSSYALVPILDWAVFVERPLSEAHAPIYASLLRTSILLLIGLGVALLATLLVSRRVVRPLETLRHAVERIRQGDLSARLDVKTGDEIEALADEFNAMAANLREAQASLENKVAERTQALTIANKRLEEASQLKSQFLANVNHELRTPVSAIIGYARLVLRETDGRIPKLQRENLQDLLHNAERLLNQIDSLLDFTKIEAGKMETHIEAVKVSEIIDGAVSTIEPTLNGAVVRIIREIASNLPELNTDREKLREVVLNLLDNAAKFTERGEIKVVASQQNGSLKLVVTDTGIGIDSDELRVIFEEFHRGRLSAGNNYRGTGLGLAIAKQFVNLLGGAISVESQPGKGSAFTVLIPFNPDKRVDHGVSEEPRG